MTQQAAEPVALAANPGIPTRSLVHLTVALRIFVGLDWFSNVIAKIVGQNHFDWGFFDFNLVNQDTAHRILQQAVASTHIAPLHWFYGSVVLPNFGFFQGFLLLAELGVAIGLTFGLLTRVAAIGGLLLLGPIWLMLLHTNQYLWTYPLDLFPLLLLAIVPAGRVAGLDGKIIRRLGKSVWPL
ncbi:hypothetical protein VSH64_23605 [Amycolatopsis rhabdoformis]|uniref:DoxX family membrane protein n=1 Tax=Amycolatopsis rhabdoformis TaxID=1448059 RepID=A0ABZ1IMF3_9PSEU|nr:hypothetical protein [Amycolatopsis rhabdoformis]WSE35021.1 hypothetical protein VSH64_23605 [Amycolatopsis rhabdoformis]